MKAVYFTENVLTLEIAWIFVGNSMEIQWTFPLITKIIIQTKISSQLERASQN
jgi:hypothetical protein